MKQVILIGDSIRIGYQDVVRDLLASAATVWSPDENGGTSANVLAHLDEWILSRSPDVVHINAGLHDLRKDFDAAESNVPIDAYRANITEVLAILSAKTNATAIWALTTPVNQQSHHQNKGFDRFEADVDAYNAVASEAAAEVGVAVNDLFAVMTQAGADRYLSPDGVHFTGPGYDLLGAAVAGAIRNVL